MESDALKELLKKINLVQAACGMTGRSVSRKVCEVRHKTEGMGHTVKRLWQLYPAHETEERICRTRKHRCVYLTL
jgi:hypothetical protein